MRHDGSSEETLDGGASVVVGADDGPRTEGAAVARDVAEDAPAPSGSTIDTSEPSGAPAGGRGAVVAQLAASIAALASVGDLEGARLLGEALQRLLAAPAGDPNAVVDLAAERARRGR